MNYLKEQFLTKLNTDTDIVKAQSNTFYRNNSNNPTTSQENLSFHEKLKNMHDIFVKTKNKLSKYNIKIYDTDNKNKSNKLYYPQYIDISVVYELNEFSNDLAYFGFNKDNIKIRLYNIPYNMISYRLVKQAEHFEKTIKLSETEQLFNFIDNDFKEIIKITDETMRLYCNITDNYTNNINTLYNTIFL